MKTLFRIRHTLSDLRGVLGEAAPSDLPPMGGHWGDWEIVGKRKMSDTEYKDQDENEDEEECNYREVLRRKERK